MKRALAAALLLAALPAAARAQTPRKHALLIGLNKYLRPISVPELRFAENDVNKLKSVLEKRGYEVTAVRSDEASRSRVIAELYRLATTVKDTDDFILYYAGHGVRNRLPSRKTYWLTYDADLEYLDVSGIRLQHLLDYVQDIRARRKLILLDHCFSGDIVVSPASAPPAPPAPGPGPGGPGERGPEGSVNLSRGGFPLGEIRAQVQASGEGLVIITAARAGAIEVAGLDHGVFTAA
ncbi:MAG TPA: caspase family protein, partial [Vicinamibacteria bacterium]|nr:caspase family protein [Vicinamibacteria bacterium]